MLHFLIVTKRQLKRPAFWFILALFPCFTVLFAGAGGKAESSIRVALSTPGEDSFSADLVTKLLKREGLIHFTFYESEAELYRQVATGAAECGYVFREDLLERLNDGHKNRLVDLVVSPDTTMDKIINEVIYSELFEEYSLHLLLDYLRHRSVFSKSVFYGGGKGLISDLTLSAKATALYRRHMSDGSTFSFTYVNGIDDYRAQAPSLLLSPIRGLTALLLVMGGFCGALNYYNDLEHHVLDHRGPKDRVRFLLLSVMIPVLLLILPGLLCLWFSGNFTLLPSELAGLLLLTILVTLSVSLLTRLIPKKLYFCSLIPVLLIGSLVFSPVFLDISRYLPALRILRYFFPATYYLDLFP